MIRKSSIFIVFIVISVSVIGSFITQGGMEWYDTLNLPSFTPPGSVIGTVWTIIFALCIASAILVWNIKNRDQRFKLIVSLFLINAVLNVLWSALFFGWHLIGWAVVEAVALDLSVILLVIFIWPKNKLAASLLIPYAVWGAFASFLTLSVWQLN